MIIVVDNTFEDKLFKFIYKSWIFFKKSVLQIYYKIITENYNNIQMYVLTFVGKNFIEIILGGGCFEELFVVSNIFLFIKPFFTLNIYNW